MPSKHVIITKTGSLLPFGHRLLCIRHLGHFARWRKGSNARCKFNAGKFSPKSIWNDANQTELSKSFRFRDARNAKTEILLSNHECVWHIFGEFYRTCSGSSTFLLLVGPNTNINNVTISKVLVSPKTTGFGQI